MTENEVRAIALFFFYTWMNDQKAIDSGARALNLAKEKKRRRPELSNNVALVEATHEIFLKEEHEMRNFRATSAIGHWNLPDGTDLGPWREFHKHAASEELEAMIWSQILGLPDQDIAQALNLPEGTIRYRVGHALRKLGELTGSRPQIV